MSKVRVKIKQMGETAACGSLSFGQDYTKRRALEIGEVLELDEDDPMFEQLWDIGVLEITREMPTRPLDYANDREAQLCAPSKKSSGPGEDLEIEQAKEAVQRRMFPELHADEVAKGQAYLDSKTRQRRRQVGQAAAALANEALS